LRGILRAIRPRLVLVQGDTNTTLGGGLAAVKSGVPIAHVEAGLRSYDLRMQEEYNRRIVDHVSSYLFAPTRASKRTLLDENVWGKKYVTGNTVIDACNQHVTIASRKSCMLKTLRFKGYALTTIYKAENVENPEMLRSMVESMMEAPVPVIMPVHPRTEKRLKENDLGRTFSKHANFRSFRQRDILTF